jgi:hypothetical protein
MNVRSARAAKRKRAAMRNTRADVVLGSPIVGAATSRSSLKSVLVIDVGGTSVKILATGQTEKRSFRSGPTLTPKAMVARVKKLAADWTYDVASIGYPGPVLRGRVIAEPYNLGRGWVGFDFARAFGCPVKIINDAALQAVGSYKRGQDAISWPWNRPWHRHDHRWHAEADGTRRSIVQEITYEDYVGRNWPGTLRTEKVAALSGRCCRMSNRGAPARPHGDRRRQYHQAQSTAAGTSAPTADAE